jgi:hypothetical protein
MESHLYQFSFDFFLVVGLCFADEFKFKAKSVGLIAGNVNHVIGCARNYSLGKVKHRVFAAFVFYVVAKPSGFWLCVPQPNVKFRQMPIF